MLSYLLIDIVRMQPTPQLQDRFLYIDKRNKNPKKQTLPRADYSASNCVSLYGSGLRQNAFLSVLLLFTSVLTAQAQRLPTAHQGILDLRTVHFAQQPVELRGQWKWYWNQLRFPSQPEGSFEYITFPQLWASSNWHKAALGNQGFATYGLTVLLPSLSDSLMLELPDQYTSYRLFVNGQAVAQDGNPASSSPNAIPYWSTQQIRLPASRDTLQLLLQIANFQHAKGGSAKAIRLGKARQLEAELATDRALDLFLTGCLIMTGLFFLGLFGFSRTDWPMLYFGLFCLIYSYRIVGTDQYVLHSLFPCLSWGLTIRLEYGSLYAAIAFFVIYTQSLYPKDTHTQITAAMAWVCVAFAGSVVVLPSVLFTWLLDPFLGLMIAYIGYALYVYWIAARRHRPGARYSLMSTGLLLIVFSLILGQYFGLSTPIKFSLFIGYLSFFFLQSLVLLFRFDVALTQARVTEKQFLANMSHEIRTPLNAILGFSGLLETTTLTDEQQEFVGYIGTAGKNLLTIVNDILDIAKIEAGMFTLEVIPFSIPSLVDSIRTMLHPAASDKKLSLTVEIDSAIPPILLGDPTRLTQILLNLMSNAVKFTQHGGVQVRVEKSQQTLNSVRIRFIIQDTGIGMPADILPHIFERFRQANDSTTRQYGGTGLGLSIVQLLAKLQGGWVNVSSTLGEGSCFTVEVPYQLAPHSANPSTGKTSVQWGAKDAGLRILVVEDNLMNQRLALGVLSRLGHMGQLAENGQQALDRLNEATFDLILMDIQMPIMDGYRATRQIRTVLGSQVPIIAMTAHALASEREQCLQAGMNDFLPKPFQPADLQRLLLKYVPISASAATSIQSLDLQPALESLVSIDLLLSVAGGDRAFARELVDLFLAQTPVQIDQIRQAVVDNDLLTISRVVHTQKAAIGLFGLLEVSQQIHTLEGMFAAKPSPPDIIPFVERYLITLEAALPSIRQLADTLMKPGH